MDFFHDTSAPPEYEQVAWIADVAVYAQALGWALSYVEMMYRSIKDRTYGMSLLALCSNFAWEFTYAVIYPASGKPERIMLTTWLILNVGVMACVIAFAPNEWNHAPLVKRNLPLIVGFSTLAFGSGQVALAATVGPGLAANWGSMVCFELVCAGNICQLLSRESSRGVSYTMWFSRFFGSFIGYIFYSLRAKHWPQTYSWLDNPITQWNGGVCCLLEMVYVVLLWHVKRNEKLTGKKYA
ncbi:hypothetical protein MHUMG1_08923 [Metarhizium humberi]|uniref:Uncharacterized protein n=1 Tax=Metarhizium humberi TaxID=2596975 RepID=A0A9P8M2N7_9HYPO|nr:hypothetical protein MHUMG1_08923 [Metarhizium humberi]